jgi:hypothetical protein
MSNHPRSTIPTAILSGAMVLLLAEASFAGRAGFRHYSGSWFPPAATSDVAEFDDGGHSLTLPGGATIGGSDGPQGQPSSGSAASFGSDPTLSVTSPASSPRRSASGAGGGGNGAGDDPCADDFFGEADRC